MKTTIDVKDLTLKQYLRLKGIKVIPDIENKIHIPTYYRLLKWDYKRGAQEKSLEKLRSLLEVDSATFDIMLHNQRKAKWVNR